ADAGPRRAPTSRRRLWAAATVRRRARAAARAACPVAPGRGLLRGSVREAASSHLSCWAGDGALALLGGSHYDSREGRAERPVTNPEDSRWRVWPASRGSDR